MSTILTWLDIEKIDNVDSGFGMINFVPLPIRLCGLILVITTVFLLIKNFLNLTGTKKRNLIWLITFTLLSFVVIKGTIDGGILARTNILNIFMLYLLAQDKYPSKILGVGTLINTISSLLLFSTDIIEKDTLIVNLKTIVLLTIIYCGLINLIEHTNIRLKLLSGIMILLAIISSGLSQEKALSYESIIINPNDTVFINSSGEPTLVDFKDYKLSKFKTEKNLSVSNLAKERKLLTNILPIQVPYKSCIPNGTSYKYNFRLITSDIPITYSIKNDFVNTALIKAENKKDLNVVSYLNPCSPNPLKLMVESISFLGLNKFIITDIKQEKQ